VKIRSISYLDSFLDRALARRKKELTTLRFAVDRAPISERSALRRAAVALLYAHWEGFIREAGAAYVELVSRQELTFAQLASNFLALAVRGRIARAGHGPGEGYRKLVTFFREGLGQPAHLVPRGSVRAQSNLDSRVLYEILATLGLDDRPYRLKAKPIVDRLVKARNSIAHGDQTPVDDPVFGVLHSEILALLDVFRDQVSDAAATKRYLAEQTRLMLFMP
jgi:hypothetical protein